MAAIFCSTPFDPHIVDEDYLPECSEAALHGKVGLISHENLSLTKSSYHLDEAIYRGWMLSADKYKALYDKLAKHDTFLINTPEQYEYCHHFPNSYEAIKDITPESKWIPLDLLTNDIIYDVLTLYFDSKPLIIKDYVKSRKHEWNEACFIPSGNDIPSALKVINTFIQRQAEDLQGGLIIRKFEKFKQIGIHPQSSMPLSMEVRVFCKDGKPVYIAPYWPDCATVMKELPMDFIVQAAARIKNSRFFTMDIAQKEDGQWMVVELGDGQVAGLPDNANIKQFYESLLSPSSNG